MFGFGLSKFKTCREKVDHFNLPRDNLILPYSGSSCNERIPDKTRIKARRPLFYELVITKVFSMVAEEKSYSIFSIANTVYR